MTPEFLVTHSGGFHADELLSSVLLTRLYPDAKLIRSRDAAWITPDPDRIIYDVGGIYDAERQIFDHHQRGAPLRDDGNPFSSFGLVWKHFGRCYLEALGLPAEQIDPMHAAFDRKFVLPIDLLDNGAISPSAAGPLADVTLPVLLETLKPTFDQRGEGVDDQSFFAAIPVARAFVEGRIAQDAAKLRAEAVVMAAIERAGDCAVLELPAGMPFRAAIEKAGADHLLFVVHPRDGNDWCVTGIRRSDEGFALRADLPAHWAGLTDAALEAATGVPGAKFCHNARFIAAATTREAARALADLAVAERRA